MEAIRQRVDLMNAVLDGSEQPAALNAVGQVNELGTAVRRTVNNKKMKIMKKKILLNK